MSRPQNLENLMSLADQLVWGMSTYGSMFNYETQTGALAEPVTASKGNGHVVAVYNSTQDILVWWVRGNADTTWFRKGEETEASYIIWSDGLTPSTYYAKNGTTGAIDFSGTDAATVIQTTINALTPGRTWQQKIVVKGNYELTAKVTLDSYTILEIDGKIKVADNMNDNGIFANEETMITIINGEVDGNGANQGALTNINTILFDTCTNSRIYNVRVGGSHRNATDGESIKFLECVDCEVIGCSFYSYTGSYDPIKFWLSHGCVALGNTIDSSGTLDSGAIQIAYGRDNVVQGNVITCSVAGGFTGAGIKIHYSEYNLVTGNLIKQSGWVGIDIIDTASFNTVENNIIRKIGGSTSSGGYFGMGIRVREASGGNIGTGNKIRNNDIFLKDGVASVIGIQVTTSGLDTLVEHNTVTAYGEVSYGVVIMAGAEDTELRENKFYDITTPCVDAGTGTEFDQLVFPFISAAGGATLELTGIEIQAAAENAIGWGYVPKHVSQVMNLIITGKTNQPDAEGVTLEIRYYAGAESELYNQVTETLVNQLSVDVGTLADNENLRWVHTSATLKSITGDYNFVCQVLYEDAVGNWIATDARVQCIVLDYV